MDYQHATLDLADDSEAAVARRRGWITAVLRGFREDRPSDELIDRWVTHYRADDVTARGVWLPEDAFGAGAMPVATYASLDKTLQAGHGLLPLRMITDVTSSPSHRRRGLLRAMIEADLADAVAHDVPVAALTASEATIYGRWGFGPATFNTVVELDTSAGFALRSSPDRGHVEVLEPADAWPHVRAVFDAFHARQRGSVQWPTQYDDIHSGAFDFNGGGENRKIRTALHLDADGTVDGFAVFKHGEDYSLTVEEMIALSPDAQLGLWDFLAHVDRVRKVTFNLAHPEDPLRWALADVDRLKVTGSRHFLWLRVLDVARVLAARPWTDDGTVVLEVEDAQGWAAGRYAVTTHDGRATITRTEAGADVRLDAETLGALCLGGVDVRTLWRAGRVHGDDDAVGRWAGMADLAVPPYCLTGF